MKMSLGCCDCDPCPGVCTLRVFDTSDGELLWQKEDLTILGSAHSGKLFGVRFRRVDPTDFKRQNWCIVAVSPNALTTFPSGNANRFQLKDLNGELATTNTTTPIWTADIVEIATNGTETTLAEGVFHTEGSSCRADWPGLGVASYLRGNYFSSATQKWQCNDDGLIILRPEWTGQVFPEAFDRDRLSTTHRFIIPATVLFAANANPARWVFEVNGTIIRIPLYGTATEFETAFESVTGVGSCTVTGGPACASRLVIDIEFDEPEFEIKNAIVENASQSYSSASSYTNGNSPLSKCLWDLNTFQPLVVGWPKADAGPLEDWSFTSDGEGLITSGPWGASFGIGQKRRSWSRIEWTMPGGTPDWGVFSRVWNQDLYADWNQIQPGTGRTTLLRGMSAVRDGQIGVCSTSCRLTSATSGDFTTHYILDESDGSTIEQGWNGLLSFSAVEFDYNGNWYFTGTRKQLSGTNFAEVAFVESYGSTSGGDDLREQDFFGTFSARGIDTNIVRAGGNGVYLPPSYQARANSTTLNIQTNWLVRTETRAAEAAYPHGFYRRDSYTQLSPRYRFSESTEWRILHGSLSGTTFTANKTSDWYAYDVALATVKADLLAWYGTVTGGTNPIAEVNPFGDDPFLEGQTPELPTWQLIRDLRILRDLGSTPNPLGPLAPTTVDTIRIEFRDSVALVSKSMLGCTPSTGVITWQRDVGTKSGVSALWQMVRCSNGQVVAATECSPTIVPDVYPRGGS